MFKSIVNSANCKTFKATIHVIFIKNRFVKADEWNWAKNEHAKKLKASNLKIETFLLE